jgi:serine phosphatase RsbU (regulator of sigma subunit)
MDEYAVFSLGGNLAQPVGVLVAGNTHANRQYHARVTAESEFVVGLANLVAQVTTAIHMSREIQAREQRLQHEARSRERIEQELRVARLIQQTLLPKELPEMAGWEIARHYQPARAVGGDFYDVLQLPDGRIGFVIGDVTDKGIPAALLMAITRSVLRAVAQRHSTASAVLTEANMILCPDVPRNMFVTCFYAILDPRNGRLQYANAGHNFPYRTHDGQVTELEAAGLPMGVLPTIRYTHQETTLHPGDSLLFYSDGLIEAHNAQREMFSFERLERMIMEHASSGELLIARLLDEHVRFTGRLWVQEDDMTLVALRWLPQ